MNKFLIIHGLIIFLGLGILDPFCQECPNQDKSKSLFSKSSLKPSLKIKSANECLLRQSLSEYIFNPLYLRTAQGHVEKRQLLKSYNFSSISIRAPPA